MNQLRQLMLEELRSRNFADTTIRTYLHGVAHFSRYFRRPPDQLGPEEIRKYQAMLFTKLKFSPNTVILRLASLRFFYIHVLKRGWSIAETPYPKKVRHLPGVLSQEEVARLIEAADTPFHRILLMTMYATGARRAEAAHLKVSDIDSKRMVVHIREGKGGKDRDVMLSPKLLEELRLYWRGLRRKPKEWLFPGNRWHTASYPVTTKVLWTACQIAAERAGLTNRHIHSGDHSCDKGWSSKMRINFRHRQHADRYLKLCIRILRENLSGPTGLHLGMQRARNAFCIGFGYNSYNELLKVLQNQEHPSSSVCRKELEIALFKAFELAVQVAREYGFEPQMSSYELSAITLHEALKWESTA